MVGFGYVDVWGGGEDDVGNVGFVVVLFFDGFLGGFGGEFGDLDDYDVVVDV